MPYTHLTPFERGIVEFLYRAYCSIRFIARMLKRSPSTISRELCLDTALHSSPRTGRHRWFRDGERFDVHQHVE